MPEPTEVVGQCANPSCKASPGANLNLSSCGGCKKVRYCSKSCQAEHWPEHKAFCKRVSTAGASSSSLDTAGYYTKIAGGDPQAQALARELGLNLPGKNTQFRGIRPALHRLVATGRDTPSNLALFFGRRNIAEVEKDRAEVRIEVLLRPPPGSPSYVLMNYSVPFESHPQSAWTPREASPDEQRRVEEAWDMQRTIREHMGARGVEDVSPQDMREILVNNFGNRWPDKIHTYTLALNTMDRGVRV